MQVFGCGVGRMCVYVCVFAFIVNCYIARMMRKRAFCKTSSTSGDLFQFERQIVIAVICFATSHVVSVLLCLARFAAQ